MSDIKRSTGFEHSASEYRTPIEDSKLECDVPSCESSHSISECLDQPTAVPSDAVDSRSASAESAPLQQASWDSCLSSCGIECVPDADVEQPNWLGHLLGSNERYEIQSFIGRGGMGNVYLAVDRNRNNAKVAVKVPSASLLSRPGIRDRFEREFQAMVELEHPSICRVLDTGNHEGVPYLVLQNLAGGSLREKYLSTDPNTYPRTIENLLSWLRPVASALNFVHSRNYIHRDVKPENILFDSHGHAYLSDFGIVRVVNEQNELQVGRLTQHDSWLGTPGYIAPEVGTDRPIDGRADLYALAAVAYVYLTGQSHAAGKTKEAIRVAQLTAPPTPPHEINGAVPPSLSEALLRALAVDPDDRQDSCESFVDELAAAIGTHPSTTDTGTPPRLTPARWRPRLTALLVSVVAVGCGLAWLAVHFSQSRNLFALDRPREQVKGQAERVQAATAQPGEIAAGQRHHDNATVYLADGEPDEAVRETTRAIELNPQEAMFYATRAEALTKEGHIEEAIAQYDQAIKIAPTADYYADRGMCYLAKHDPQRAAEDFTRAIQLDDGEHHYHAYRALAHLRQDKFRAAIDDYTAALDRGRGRASKDNLAAWHNGRGYAYLRCEDALGDALNDATRAVQLQPQEPRHLRNRAEIHRRLNNTVAAAEDIAAAQQLEAKN